jgi:glycosyltransferase involved in cell wall biosynthesis
MINVTVLIPVYNNKNDIIHAIQSIIDQTYQDWEIIVIDDCSTDGTFELVKDFIANNEYRIQLIRNKINQGTYISLNEGLVRAKGEYICRIDSDDTVANNHIELNMRELTQDPSYVASKTTIVNRATAQVLRYGEASLFYKKSIINEIGYYDSVRFGADSEFRYRIIKKYGNKILELNHITYYMQYRDGSLTTSEITGNKIIRGEYMKEAKKWHDTTKNLYMPYPLHERLFSVDPIMLP